MNMNSSEENGSHNIVTSTIRDLFEFQQNALDKVRLKAEKQKVNYVPKESFDELKSRFESLKLDHTKLKIMLDDEKEKNCFLENQVEILNSQINKEREKNISHTASLQDKASRETKRCDFLIEKLNEAEHEIEKQQSLLDLKNIEITELKKRLKIQKENHKQKLQEIDIAKMQEEYLIKTLSNSQSKKAAA